MKTTKNALETLKYDIAFLEKNVAEGNKKLAENFTYYFPWLGEELWVNTYKAAYMKSALEDTNGGRPLEVVLAHHIKFLRDYTSRVYNVRENSSGSLHREVSTWKFQANMALAEYFEAILNTEK